MTTRISTLDMRHKLGEILVRVALRHDQYIVERKGRPMAALLPVEKAEAMERASRLHLVQLLDRAQDALSEAEGDRLADLAKHKSRRT